MKNLLYIFIITSIFFTTENYSQAIGEVVPEKQPEVFPSNAWGMDIMVGDAGFGLGTFLRKQLDLKWTATADISVSEAKDDREFEFYDYYLGTFVTANKKNRIFQIPLNFGLQYRLFENEITDNLRPYLNAAVGPTLLITTPYSEEFFSAFGKAQAKYALGGYVGLGANFGLDKSSLVGVNIRYYYSQILGDGVESLQGKVKKNIQGFFITLNLGLMY
jgi:hypothetical protein